MDRTKAIERYIRQSIKKCNFSYDKIELKNLIELMTKEEISMFWFRYSSTIAYNEANANVPHWQTSLQQKYFRNVSSSLYYYPKYKTKEGKYIIDRDDLIEHIFTKLTIHIDHEIQAKINFKNQSFLEKSPFYLFVGSALMLPFLFVCMIFEKNSLCRMFVLFFCIYYGVCILSYPALRLLIKNKNKRKIKSV